MISEVHSFRFDLPFYLRLPGAAFPVWDPGDRCAGLLPRQRLGEVAFSKTTQLVPEDRLLDARVPAPYEAPRHGVAMVCETPDYGIVPTLRVDTGPNGGCAELRPFTEVCVFVSDAVASDAQLPRVFAILNNFIGLYRLVTQDPWVTQVDRELDIYLVDRAIATVPETHRSLDFEALLLQLGTLEFATGVDAQRNHSYRLNTLEDLFPGRVLDQPFLEALAVGARERYDMPLHYELVLLAQTQLKRRKYRFAVLEAETAFEVYVADLLVGVLTQLGGDRRQILEDLENPRKLGLLSQRLKALDAAAGEWRRRHSGAPWVPFVNSQLHTDWKSALYLLRNQVVHAGAHSVTRGFKGYILDVITYAYSNVSASGHTALVRQFELSLRLGGASHLDQPDYHRGLSEALEAVDEMEHRLDPGGALLTTLAGVAAGGEKKA
jgi:hypothetical protein